MKKLHLLIALVCLSFASTAHAQLFYFEMTGTDRGAANTLYGDFTVNSGAVTNIDVNPFTLNYGAFGSNPAGSMQISALTFSGSNLGSAPSNNHVAFNGDGTVNLSSSYFFSNAGNSENITISTLSNSNVSMFGGVFPGGTINSGTAGATVIVSSTPLATPEPSAWALMLGGVASLIWRLRTRRA